MKRWLALLGFLVTLCLASCAYISVKPVDLLESDAIVHLRNGPGGCTAFNADGHWLTAAHCVEFYDDLAFVDDLTGVETKVRLIKKDDKRDLALLEANIISKRLPLATDLNLRLGTKLTSIGYSGLLFSQKVATETLLDTVARVENVQLIFARDLVDRGVSGGPVFNENGQVIGIATAMVRRADEGTGQVHYVGIAVSIAEIRAFLSE